MSISFRVTFIKNKEDNSKDDFLKIQKEGDSYSWTFKDAGVSHYQTATIESSYDVTERFNTLLKMVATDSDPPKFVQVDVPGFPQVLYDIKELSYNAPAIRDALYYTLCQWPEWVCNKHGKAIMRREYADEAHDETAQEEMSEREKRREAKRWMRRNGRLRTPSVADDLPPLVPTDERPTARHLYF